MKESDQNIWNWAKRSDFSILSQDSGFYFMSVVNGCPPKIIRLNCKNLSTSKLTQKILSNIYLIIRFLDQVGDSYLEIN